MTIAVGIVTQKNWKGTPNDTEELVVHTAKVFDLRIKGNVICQSLKIEDALGKMTGEVLGSVADVMKFEQEKERNITGWSLQQLKDKRGKRLTRHEESTEIRKGCLGEALKQMANNMLKDKADCLIICGFSLAKEDVVREGTWCYYAHKVSRYVKQGDERMAEELREINDGIRDNLSLIHI